MKFTVSYHIGLLRLLAEPSGLLVHQREEGLQMGAIPAQRFCLTLKKAALDSIGAKH
jgi:hypothetical protein